MMAEPSETIRPGKHNADASQAAGPATTEDMPKQKRVAPAEREAARWVPDLQVGASFRRQRGQWGLGFSLYAEKPNLNWYPKIGPAKIFVRLSPIFQAFTNFDDEHSAGLGLALSLADPKFIGALLVNGVNSTADGEPFGNSELQLQMKPIPSWENTFVCGGVGVSYGSEAHLIFDLCVRHVF
jgi:hypothetical protein